MRMDDNSNRSNAGVIAGGIIALAVVTLVLASGEFGGKKVKGDADMPPISSPEKTYR